MVKNIQIIFRQKSMLECVWEMLSLEFEEYGSLFHK